MSGYLPSDKNMEENVGNDYPAMNGITSRGFLPSDQIPSASKSIIIF